MMNCLRHFFIAAFCCTISIINAYGQAPVPYHSPNVICSDSLVWNSAKPPLPPSVKVAVVSGNPHSDSLFIIRVIIPPHVTMEAHSHPTAEYATVLSGKLFIGSGMVPDDKISKAVQAGCFYKNEKDRVHYFFTGEEGAVLQVTAIGPWGVKLADH